MRVRMPADLFHVGPGRIEVEIEMEVDVEIELAGDTEDATNMCCAIAIGIGTAADQIRAGLAGRNQHFLAAGIIDQALLREDTKLEVDRPRVIRFQLADSLETQETDPRID